MLSLLLLNLQHVTHIFIAVANAMLRMSIGEEAQLFVKSTHDPIKGKHLFGYSLESKSKVADF